MAGWGGVGRASVVIPPARAEAARSSRSAASARRAARLGTAEPKTANSRRVIRVPAFALNTLRTHHQRQVAERLACPIPWGDERLVFTTELGTLVDGKNLLRFFKRHVEKAGLDPKEFNLHSLRHSAATLLLSEGVSEMLGHSSVRISLDVYSHVLPHLQEEAAAKMDQVLTGAAEVS